MRLIPDDTPVPSSVRAAGQSWSALMTSPPSLVEMPRQTALAIVVLMNLTDPSIIKVFTPPL